LRYIDSIPFLNSVIKLILSTRANASRSLADAPKSTLKTLHSHEQLVFNWIWRDI